ncbi:Putative cytochrome P450 [Colletotrichum destructivum]|uniref:Cytochrome P450 n=1 Tax=Colletotrichum destructivum TaxID=34406 RepID=A0AAX4IXD1_9PEZI|nr:Putative cytochrome P450 [Colletotrichum destructivum]
MLAPALNVQAIRGQELVVHEHVDSLVRQIGLEMNDKPSVEMRQWIDWHTWDLASDVAYNLKCNQVKDNKSSGALHPLNETELGFLTMYVEKDELFFSMFVRVGLWATTQQVALTFPTGIRVQRQTTTVQTCHIAMTRSERWFEDARSICPGRFLPNDHQPYDTRSDRDARGSFAPFSLGPRGYPCTNSAMRRLRIVIAQMVWSFDMKLTNKDQIDWERDAYLYGIWEHVGLWVKTILRPGLGKTLLA